MSEKPIPASPPCFACEMDEAYAGYLPKGELAAALERLLTLAAATTQGRWQEMLAPIVARLNDSPAKALPSSQSDLVPGTLEQEARALLPRIKDDGIHAALKRLIETPDAPP